MKCELYEYAMQHSSGMSAKCLSSVCPFSQSARLKLACVSSLAVWQFSVYQLWRSRKNDASVDGYMLVSEGTGSVFVMETLYKHYILYTKCHNVSLFLLNKTRVSGNLFDCQSFMSHL